MYVLKESQQLSPQRGQECEKSPRRTLTDGKLSGGVLELVRKAFASRYPAELKSFQPPTSSLEK